MKPITTEKELYLEMLKDIYSAEVKIVGALMSFKKSTDSPALTNLIKQHTGVTRMQILRLEEMIEELDDALRADHCRTMLTLIEESKELVNRCTEAALKDKAITLALNRINQCELQVYHLLNDNAREVIPEKFWKLLEYNLNEEEEFREALHGLVAQTVN